MQEPATWISESLVNTTTAGDQTEPSVVGLVGGGYVIAWTSKEPSEPYETYVQMFDASGNKVGTEIFVGDYMHSPVVAATADGGFIVLADAPDFGGTYGVIATVFDSTGTPTSAFPVNTEEDPSNPIGQREPAITALSDGTFAVVYQGDQNDGTTTIYLQRLDATGAKLGDQEIVTVTDNTTYIYNLDVAALANGHFTVVWTTDTNGEQDVFMQRYVNDGTKDGTVVPVADQLTDQYGSAIAADGDGGFLVAYGDASGGVVAGDNIVGQLFDDDGNPIDQSNPPVPGFAISDPGQNGPSADGLALIGLPTGGYFAAWMEYFGGTSTIVGQLLDSSGAKVGGEIVIKEPTGTDFVAYNVALAVLADGRIVVTWKDETHDQGDTEGAGIHSLIIDPRGGDIIGTENGEAIFGSPYGNDTADTIKALGGNDTIDGYDGNDSMEGGAGHDVFYDTNGADTMDGGEGDDVFYVDNIGDVVKEAVGGGSDKIIFQLYSDFVLASGVEVEAIELVGSDNNNLTGNEFGQLLEGSAGRNKLMGQGGNDTLDGGGADGDTLEGGEGNDVYILQTAATIVTEALNQGTDTIVTDFTYSIENRDNVENLTLVGSADIDGTGSSLDNYLTGNDNDNDLFGLAGDDTLDGGLGTDSLAGGLGNDYYLFNQLSDLLMEDIDEGIDTVASKFDHTLAENFENLILTGFGTVGTGNGANNELTGNKLANTLTGLAGNDTLDGGGGDDTMVGGTGNDYYLVSDPGDVVTELANEGTDTVASQIDYVLGATLENLVLTGPATKGTGNATNNKLTGNGLGNVLKGGAGSDTIDGGAGTDSVVGGSGNDSYVLGNGHDVVTDSSGTDDRITSTISRNLANYTGIENLTLVGTGTVNGTGNAAANDLIGNAAANKLSGGAGNDLLRGMNGADLLTGGSGRDTFDFNTVIEIGKGAGQRDIVRDFKHGIDTLDLGAIDADTTKSGNQKFKFVATEGAAFTGIKGQLTWDQKNYAGTDKDMTLVSGDINGDGIADFRIELRGLVSLTAGDFIL